MAGLPWVRLDSAFPTNPKVLALIELKEGHRTAFVYLCGLAYSGAHGTDGLIRASALPFIHGRKADALRLVHVGLWHSYPDGGWLINGWDEKQVTNEGRQARKQLARDAANVRWHGRKDVQTS